MKTDTPRTDAATELYGELPFLVPAIPVEFARQLELELAHSLENQVKAQAEVDRLKALPNFHHNGLTTDKCPTCSAVWSVGVGRHNWLDRTQIAEAEVERLTKLTEDCLNVIRVHCPTYYNDAMERFTLK